MLVRTQFKEHANLMTAPNFSDQIFDDPQEACNAIEAIYEAQTLWLREQFQDFVDGKFPERKVSARYPYVLLETRQATRSDTRRSYGFVPQPGRYGTTLTRPDIFGEYYREQLALLRSNHGCAFQVGLGREPIPIHFALGEEFHLEKGLDAEQIRQLPNCFDLPSLETMDDEIANCYYVPKEGEPKPLALFTAPRVDLSLMRLKHYTGTAPEHFQNYVIFTNYQFYIDEFIRYAKDLLEGAHSKENSSEELFFEAFVEPGNRITLNRKNGVKAGLGPEHDPVQRMPQMPAYHLKRADRSGITMINIGVGPSNAKTITDHVAVLRPHAWLMLGHCAGLRNSQTLGDYVLAHGYLREDHVLDGDLHRSIPIPPLSEIQIALEQAVSEITGYQGYDLKKIMRTGTVATIDDRNWELRSSIRQNRRFSQSRAVALDMESGTIAANGFRFRVPYGTLLCVSDKPLHGQPKLPGMADAFYRERVGQHLQIGLRAMRLLREIGPERLHSRKLRSFNEVAFQ